MSKNKKKSQLIPGIQELGIVDLILIDHRFIKECIEVLSSEHFDKRKKLSISKKFLDAIALHSKAEKEAVYAPLEKNEEFHFNILEAQIEHGIIDKKVKALRTRLANARTLKDEVEAELKVLAELLRNHLMEEESETLLRMNLLIADEDLQDMGQAFMKIRKFSTEDLKDYPQLQDELVQWKDSIQKVSSEFLTKMDKFVENMQH